MHLIGATDSPIVVAWQEVSLSSNENRLSRKHVGGIDAVSLLSTTF